MSNAFWTLRVSLLALIEVPLVVLLFLVAPSSLAIPRLPTSVASTRHKRRGAAHAVMLPPLL